MDQNKKIRVYEDRSQDVVEVFPEYSDLFSDKQLKHIWLPKEVKVEKDKQNILVELSPAARHGVLTVLRLFTNYEVFAGEDWWAGRFPKIMRGPEFARMGAVFSAVELAVHKPFYQQLNQVLGLDNEEFYTSYVENPVLKSRMEFIDKMINHVCPFVALGAFSMVEGGILYSSFAYLKAFQANGRNDVKTIISGINYSLADEGLHSIAAATCFRHLHKECHEDGVFMDYSNCWTEEEVKYELEEVARQIYLHEAEIIEMIFEQGSEGMPCTKVELLAFVRARLNACLINLGYSAIFDEDGDTISEWFYKSITSFVMHDFFNSLGSQYTSTWQENDFDPRNLVEEEDEKE